LASAGLPTETASVASGVWSTTCEPRVPRRRDASAACADLAMVRGAGGGPRTTLRRRPGTMRVVSALALRGGGRGPRNRPAGALAPAVVFDAFGGRAPSAGDLFVGRLSGCAARVDSWEGPIRCEVDQRPERVAGPRLGEVQRVGVQSGDVVEIWVQGGPTRRRNRARCRRRPGPRTMSRVQPLQRRRYLCRASAVGGFAPFRSWGSPLCGGRKAHQGSEASCCGHTLQWCPRKLSSRRPAAVGSFGGRVGRPHDRCGVREPCCGEEGAPNQIGRYGTDVMFWDRANHRRGSEHPGDGVGGAAACDVFEENPGSVGSRSCTCFA
jgi:hypothetical protein